MFKFKSQATLFITMCFATISIVNLNEALGAAETSPNPNYSKEDEINISQLSEAFGHFIGKNLKSPGVAFDLEAVIRGIRNGATGKPAPMNDQEYENAMSKLQE